MDRRKQKIENEVEQTLAAFDQAEQLQVSPWFATRVKAKLDTSSAPAASMGFFGFRSLRPALLALIVLLNLVTAAVAIQQFNESSESRDTYLTSFASEYAFATNDSLLTLDE